jgi:hypothetical protein
LYYNKWDWNDDVCWPKLIILFFYTLSFQHGLQSKEINIFELIIGTTFFQQYDLARLLYVYLRRVLRAFPMEELLIQDTRNAGY